MSADVLRPTLELLRKILLLEMRQGYRNRSTSGAGILAFFRGRFDSLDHDEASAATAESILAYLRRYEAAASTEERQAVAQIMLRRLDATLAARAAQPLPASPPGTDTRRRTMPAGQASAPAAAASPAPAAIPPPPWDGGGQLQAAQASPGQDLPTAQSAGISGHQPPAPLPPPDDELPPPDELEADDTEAQHSSRQPAGNRWPAAESSNDAAPVPLARAVVPGAASLDDEAVAALGIRPQEAKRLETLGLTTLRSVVEYWPRDHYDYSNPVRINRMRPEMQTTLIGTLRAVELRRPPGRSLQIVEARIGDPTGVMTVTWFNQPYLAKSLKPRIGEEIAISGKVELYNGRLQLAPRDVEFPADDEERVHTGRIIPVYPAAEGIAQRWLRTLVRRALDAANGLVPDPVPDGLRRQFGLMERRAAIAQYHFPSSMEARDRARNRLALDELLLIQLGMLQRKRQWQQSGEGQAVPPDPALLAAFRQGLPFTLTAAQERALGEILADMDRDVPMSRLLQGDVGSGKTVVAAAALLTCARAGLQGAIMAPTEILAEQHARTLSVLLEPHGVGVALLTGSVPKARRARIYLEALQGSIQVLAGTHALIQEDFKFGRLGLAIVDEQHRFGVAQRAALKGKGFNPHLLVMTATPIPRTLTLTIYGDLDVSIIDQRPPNRRPVETHWTAVPGQAYSLIRDQVREGRQAYIICPLVEESEKLEARAAVAEHKRLQEETFPDLRLGLLHGKMSPQEKDEALGRFRDGALDILVATSVVEVGIDVPNATVMVVQDAQRFGLAQLHQFRGRVGRGSAQSYCLLLAEANNPLARERLQALCDTDDGFKLAEEDLRLRGPGEFWGTRQSGLPLLQVANVTDIQTLDLARRVAECILVDDPALTQPQHALLADTLRRFWDAAAEPS